MGPKSKCLLDILANIGEYAFIIVTLSECVKIVCSGIGHTRRKIRKARWIVQRIKRLVKHLDNGVHKGHLVKNDKLKVKSDKSSKRRPPRRKG